MVSINVGNERLCMLFVFEVFVSKLLNEQFFFNSNSI
jgi:hypothetical protein